MAKSIFEILADLTTETSVPAIKDGKGNTIRENFGEVTHTIPENLFPDDKTFESKDDLLAWAEDMGYTHALLQKGLQKGLIDARATFKACKKEDTWSPEYGQENVDAMEWKTTTRPNQGTGKKLDEARYKDCMGMIGKLSATGMDKDTIRDMVIGIYDEEIVDSIFETLENLE